MFGRSAETWILLLFLRGSHAFFLLISRVGFESSTASVDLIAECGHTALLPAGPFDSTVRSAHAVESDREIAFPIEVCIYDPTIGCQSLAGYRFVFTVSLRARTFVRTWCR